MHNRTLLTFLYFALVALPVQKLFAQDTTPPVVVNFLPATNAPVVRLTQIEVFFSEAVQGVEASDLLVNGVAATNIVTVQDGQYLFQFSQPATGQVQVAFAAGHGISDLAANPFEGASWEYLLNPALALNLVRINEFMAVNENGIRDEDGTYQDWVELYNAAPIPVNLDGCYLTDTEVPLTNWRFPAAVMQPNSYLIVWCSDKNKTNPFAPLHTDFRLSSDGDFLALVDPTGTNIISFFPAGIQQRTDVSYGRDPLDPRLTGYYSGTNVTPGAINSAGGQGSDFAGEVTASRPSGTFVSSFPLTLSTPSPTAQIRYTIVSTNAKPATTVTNVPTTNSPLYTGPITVDQSMQVRARVFEPGKLQGTPVTFHYLWINSEVANFSSDLPIFFVHNFAQSATLPNSVDQPAIFAGYNADLGRSSPTNQPDVITRMGVNDRGSSTANQAKQHMAVELWDEFNQDIRYPVAGMPAESDWVFYGINGFDPGMLHNAIFHWFGRSLGRYSPRTKFAEVFRKTTFGPITMADYMGVYLIEEKIKRGDDRLNIEPLRPENTNAPSVTGGWLLRIDRQNDPGEVGFRPPQIGTIAPTPEPITYVDPDGVALTTDPRLRPQTNYIQNYILSFLTNLSGPNYTHPETGYAAYIDVDSWIENHIVNVICYNVDGYRLSGYFFKDRNKKLEQGPPWDCDRCLGTGGAGATPQTDGRCFNPREWRRPATAIGQDNGTDFFGVSTVGVSWWQPLFRDPDFWQKWIDRYQQFRRKEFSSQSVMGMVDGFHDEIKESQPRDQAKWSLSFTYPRAGLQSQNGYSYNFGPTNTALGRGGYFTNEVNFQKQWLSDRLNFLDTNFLNMPTLSLVSTGVTSGTVVTLTPSTKPGTVLYYTLDGTDPRLPGGAISPTALTSASTVNLTITTNVRVFARCFNLSHSNVFNKGDLASGNAVGNPLTNSFWSGPVVESYYTSVPPLRITEIMYHPPTPGSGSIGKEEFEYLEVKNISGTPLNINRFRIRGGLDFDFPNATLAAGEQAVIVRNLAAFQSRYGGTPRVLGVYTNDYLGNDEERLVLEGGFREPILDFTYNDDWYPITDGTGFSLQIVNDAAAPSTWGLKASWRPSGVLNGTPSAPDPGAPAIAQILINEASTHTDPSPADAIELYNPTDNPVIIGGWYLSDNFDAPKKFRIPNGTTIQGNSYLVFYQSNSFGLGTTGFGLSSNGEEIHLFSGDPLTGNLTGYQHGFNFGAQLNSVTFGRHVTSIGEEHFVTQVTPTLNSANSGPKIGPIVISEINYHPPDIQGLHEYFDNEDDEYIELHNVSGVAVPLYDPANPANTWKLRDAVDFTFPTGVSIPAGGFVLVVSFDPANATALEQFRSANNVPVSTPIYGPWSGQLDNSADNVELTFPGIPDPPGSPTAGFVPYILADKVDYQDLPPWATNYVDGFGGTLNRSPLTAYGNDPASWRAVGKTPGAGLPAQPGLPQIVTQPANTVVAETFTATLTVAASGPGPLQYQWLFNGIPIPGNSASLTLFDVQLDQAGQYSCVVFNGNGAVQSSSATLTVRPIATILQHPAGRAVYVRPDARAVQAGTNVTFSVVAVTQNPPLTYQWRFNGAIIPGATGSSVTVVDVQLDDEGDYVCHITDAVATIPSNPARLTPWISPIITKVHPPATNGVAGSAVLYTNMIPAGSTINFSGMVFGNPPPFGYYWRLGSSNFVAPQESMQYSSTAALTLGPNPGSATFRLIVTNAAQTNLSAGVWASTIMVVALADFDKDGIPDNYESTIPGLSTNNAADGAGDLDGDTMSNRDEYIAGTDPTNPASYLRVQENIIPGTANLQVAVISNRTYSVQYNDNLALGPWLKLGDVPAYPTNRTESFQDPTWTTNRFYRVIHPHQP